MDVDDAPEGDATEAIIIDMPFIIPLLLSRPGLIIMLAIGADDGLLALLPMLRFLEGGVETEAGAGIWVDGAERPGSLGMTLLFSSSADGRLG